MKKYPVYCVWCQQEGILTQVNESTIENSFGVCMYHFLLQLEISNHPLTQQEKEELERLKKAKK